jgi:hypothetical protein
MSRKGNCWDNARAESFFKTLKRELETLDGKHTAGEARQSVFMYVDACYNRIRIIPVPDGVLILNEDEEAVRFGPACGERRICGYAHEQRTILTVWANTKY